ncbi:Phytochrome type [Nymphaea thermarum]|nr:Phytochrome type [Nymphaea thermarum]
MSSSRPSQSSSSSSRTRRSARIIAQTTVDADLHADFEESGSSFDYTRSVAATRTVSLDQARSEKVTAYLQNIQKGKLIQPFGCLLVLDEKSFRVIAYSENAADMLTMSSHAVPSVGDLPVLGIGTDLRSIFTSTSVASLQKAAGFAEVSLLNPILVHCKSSGKPFYAIVHRVVSGLVMDFEPVKHSELPITAAGALQSYKLAAKAIARLQSLPGGSISRLCDTVVEEVHQLTGYDRVMTYKFHEDDHGEVVSEIRKPDLEPYLGLHYPATDIPQAARFLFMKNKVRMICDCRAKPVKVYQDENLQTDLTLCGSTLRAPHSCHLQYMENMSSIASLVMAVVINEGEDEGEDETEPNQRSQQQKRKRLWGLVVCHNTSPRFVPFPLRYACEFLMQVFAIHVNKEVELENQMREKNILRTQTLLCDMLLRDAPLGIVSQTPNVMDLVKCDGAALLYGSKLYLLGRTPTESQIRDIAIWLSEYHKDSTGLSTDSLYEAGYPGALAIGSIVCGMAAVRITANDMLFWFRSHTASEIRWGGAKHDPEEKDDGRRMHPRSSFKAFLEVVKTRSLPWKDFEMDAIHSLQLILRGSSKEVQITGTENIIHSRMNDLKLEGMKELNVVTNEMVRLIETASAPIFAVDINGLVNGWNTKIAELTGLSVEQVMGKHLLTLIEDCSVERVKRMLYLALNGEEEQEVQFQMKTHGPQYDNNPVILVVNACSSRDLHDSVVGVCFIAQDMTEHKLVMDKFTRIQGDYRAIVQNPSPLIPPIFGTDEFGWCSEWNAAMTKLSGWDREDVVEKMLLGEVFGTHMACCRLKNHDMFVNLGILINNAMVGQEAEKFPFGFFGRDGKYDNCLLSVSKKLDGKGTVTGVFCFLQLASQELQKALHVQRLSEETAMKKLKALSYIRHEIQNPLSGIIFSTGMLEDADLPEEKKPFVVTSIDCQRQLSKILDDVDLQRMIDGCLDLEMVEFTLEAVLTAAVSQVMLRSQEKGIRIIHDYVEQPGLKWLYGDNLRLQQVVANFLSNAVKFTPRKGLITISVNLLKDSLGKSVHLVHLELRIIHSGRGIPEEYIRQMFGTDQCEVEDAIGLSICHKILKLMNGDVQYLREADRCSFIISAELALVQEAVRA